MLEQVSLGDAKIYADANNAPQPPTTTMKRKLEDMDVDDDSLLTSSEQRQSVLDISMLKLRSGPVKKVEPSLRRSVLIFNTLKSIEAELREEGGRLPLPPLMPVRQRHHVVNNNNNAAVVVAPAAGAGVGQCCGDQFAEMPSTGKWARVWGRRAPR